MSLNLRSHSVNCYAYSKLLYKCNIVDPRSEDLQVFTSAAKSFVYIGLLCKPSETVLFRKTEDGGLGLLHIQCRAKAALLSTFLQTAINPNFHRNNFHNVLYRKYVHNENIEAPRIPQSMAGDFFPTLRELYTAFGELETLDLKTVYGFLVADIIRVREDPDSPLIGEERDLIPLACEVARPSNNWPEAWRRARLKGLGPELTSFLLKMMWGILPTRERLHKIMPKLYLTNACPLCNQAGGDQREDTGHALMDCEANQGTPSDLMALLRTYQPAITTRQVLALEIEVDPVMELPLIWITATSLSTIWSQRQEGLISRAKTRAELKAKCKFLEQSIDLNALMMTSLALDKMFT